MPKLKRRGREENLLKHCRRHFPQREFGQWGWPLGIIPSDVFDVESHWNRRFRQAALNPQCSINGMCLFTKETGELPNLFPLLGLQVSVSQPPYRVGPSPGLANGLWVEPMSHAMIHSLLSSAGLMQVSTVRTEVYIKKGRAKWQKRPELPSHYLEESCQMTMNTHLDFLWELHRNKLLTLEGISVAAANVILPNA